MVWQLWHVVWEGMLTSVVQPSAGKHSFLFLGLFQLLKRIIILNTTSSTENCIKFILHIKIEARNESILGFKNLLVISTIGFNSLSYEKFLAGNKERGGESFVGFAASAEILFL